ncbi:hypothetical protein [Acidianus sp. HS-5]|uniref:hypothetical protein n=1 Tax=Acidianus sp. HS-5 TaxID=2886040 RepID=UPI001F36D2B4|nr:hypothetical protein [Acidianus sp. HS-5]
MRFKILPFFDIFKRSKDKDHFVYDELGEWIMISRNPKLGFLYSIISKTVSKLAKYYDLYILQFLEDSEIRNFYTIKAMVSTRSPIKDSLFSSKLSQSLSKYGTLGQVNVVKLRYCGMNYLFFRFNVLLKKNKNVRADVKVLLPPLGVSTSGIPYTINDLFKSIFEYNSNAVCQSILELKDDNTARILANCNDYIDLDGIKYSLSYFSKDFKTSVKSSVRSIEIEIETKDFNKHALIPLLWNNFLDIYSTSSTC